MRHILYFSNYRTILTMTVTPCNYSHWCSPNLKYFFFIFYFLSRLTGYSNISKIVIFLGIKLCAILPPLFCLLGCDQASSSSLPKGPHQSFEYRCYAYFSPLWPLPWSPQNTQLHMCISRPCLQHLSPNLLHFPPKDGSERSVMKI